jgi:hypothetical protein
MGSPGDNDSLYGKRNGAWEYMDAGGAKEGGVWKRHERTYTKEDGVWKQVFDYCKCQVRGYCTCHGVSSCSCHGQCACNGRGCNCNVVSSYPDCQVQSCNPTVCSSVGCGWYDPSGCGCFGRCCTCMHRTAGSSCSSVNVGCSCRSDGGSPSSCPCNTYTGCNCDNRGAF